MRETALQTQTRPVKDGEEVLQCRSRGGPAAHGEDHGEGDCPPAAHGGPWQSRDPFAAHGGLQA